MHGSRRQRFVVTAAVAVSAVAAVAVALIVVSLTRPSDQEIQEEVAVHLGVSREVLDIPVVRRVLEQTSSEARAVVFDELDQSLLIGGYKQSGYGREYGSYGFEEFLETKSMQL